MKNVTIQQRILIAGIIVFILFVIISVINFRMHQEVLSNLDLRDEVHLRQQSIQEYREWKNDLIRFVSDVIATGYVPSSLEDRFNKPSGLFDEENRALITNAHSLVQLIGDRREYIDAVNHEYDMIRDTINNLYYKLDNKLSTSLARIQMDQVLGKDAAEQGALAPYVLKSLNQLTLISLESILSRNYLQSNKEIVDRNRRFLTSQLHIIDTDGSIAALFESLFSQISLLEKYIPESNLAIAGFDAEIKDAKTRFDRTLNESNMSQEILKAESEVNAANIRLRKTSRYSLMAAVIILLVIPLIAVLFGIVGLNRFLVKPISHLAEAMTDVQKGNFNVEVQIQRNDEIGELADTFNIMAGEIHKKVTDLALLNQTLKESESKYRTLVENLPQGIFLKNNMFEYVSCNDTFAEYIGLGKDDIIGKTDFDLFPEETAAEIRAEDEAFLAAAVMQESELSKIRDGETHYYLCIKTPVWDDDGQVSGMLGINADITDRKQAHMERERLATAFEQAAEIIVITDVHANIQFVNPAFEAVTGYAREDVIGRNPRILKSGRHSDEFYREMWDVLLQGRMWTGRIVNKKKDGTLFTEDARISPMTDEVGNVINYVAVKRDITDELKRDELYRQSQKLESIGQLAGGVAHDLNNLLTPVIGYGELLSVEASLTEDQRESMASILNAGYQAKELVAQLLAFSRKQTMEFGPIDLNGAVEGFESLLRRTIKENVKLNYRLSPGIRHVYGDIGQIQQVIMNLAVNASDAMPDGGELTIETAETHLDEEYTSDHPGTEPGDYIMLAVSDTGCGMDDHIRKQVFEPFFSTKGEFGTGLGLSTVYGIVKQHGGNLWLYSEPDKGTVFKIFLPVSEKKSVDKLTARIHTATRNGNETVMIVEDNEQVGHLARKVLERQGYSVIEAHNGADALHALASHNGAVHLLLTDVILPDMNGKELCEQCVELRPDIKILFMSGYTDNVIAQHGVLDEGVHFIQKPFAVQALADKVRGVLDEG